MNRVVAWVSTKSQARARWAPGPTAVPLTAATVGLSSSHSSRTKVCTPLRSASLVERGSKPAPPALATVEARRSMPEQNESPVPVTRSARTPGVVAGGAHGVHQVVAHLDAQRIAGLRPVERDAPHPVLTDFVADHPGMLSVVPVR